jgi:hypothetical protein
MIPTQEEYKLLTDNCEDCKKLKNSKTHLVPIFICDRHYKIASEMAKYQAKQEQAKQDKGKEEKKKKK